jgi:RNA polymerase sigma factor (TIGR02999 family)
MAEGAEPITLLLQRWRAGDPRAADALLPLVYAELHRIAGRAFAQESHGHTLQPTAVVHEAFVRLADASVDWQDRCHFLALMTTVIRRVLVDHARGRRREKRGGEYERVTLSALGGANGPAADLLDLESALARLEAIEPRKAQLLALHYLGGLTREEMVAVVGISRATVDRDLRFARAWLKTQLEAEPERDSE